MVADGLKTGVVFAAPDEAGGGAPAGVPEKGKSEKGELVTLTQEKLDSIISEVMGRSIKKAKAEFYEEGVNPLAKRLDELQQGLQSLQKLLDAQSAAEKDKGSKESGLERGSESAGEVISKEELEALIARKEAEAKQLLEQKEAELQTKQNAINALLQERKRQALEVAAAAAGAIQPAVVAKLLLEHLDHDEQWNLYVKNEKGGKRINDRGDPMTIEEFVGEWLTQNQYMVRPEIRAGGGTAPGTIAQRSKTLMDRIKEAEARKDIAEVIRLKRQLYEERRAG